MTANSRRKGAVTYHVLVLIARSLPFIALLLSGYLSWITLSGGIAYGCNGDASSFSCDHVLSSRWSKWCGWSVAPFGVVIYSSLAGLCWLVGNRAPWIPHTWRSLLVTLITIAAGSGIWFVVLQFAVIGHLCPYCLAVHACGISMAVILVVLSKFYPPITPPQQIPYVPSAKTERAGKFNARLAIGAGCLPVFVLIAGQIFFPEKSYLELDPQSLNDEAAQTSLGSLRGTAVPSRPVDAPAATPAANPLSATPSANGPLSVVAESAPSPPTASGGSDPIPSGKEIDKEHMTRLNDLLATWEPSESSPVPTDPTANSSSVPVRGNGRELAFFENRVKVQTLEHPISGETDAPAIVVELMDYTCLKCRQLNKGLQKAKARYGKQFAVVVLPCPLSSACNKAIDTDQLIHGSACSLARLAIAVWTVRPDLFGEYHDWLMAADEPPSVEEAVKEAARLVDHKLLQQAVNSTDTADRIAQYTGLFGGMKKSNSELGLPVQFIGDQVIAGAPEDEQELFDVWEAHLPVRKVNE